MRAQVRAGQRSRAVRVCLLATWQLLCCLKRYALFDSRIAGPELCVLGRGWTAPSGSRAVHHVVLVVRCGGKGMLVPAGKMMCNGPAPALVPHMQVYVLPPCMICTSDCFCMQDGACARPGLLACVHVWHTLHHHVASAHGSRQA